MRIPDYWRVEVKLDGEWENYAYRESRSTAQSIESKLSRNGIESRILACWRTHKSPCLTHFSETPCSICALENFDA